MLSLSPRSGWVPSAVCILSCFSLGQATNATNASCPSLPSIKSQLGIQLSNASSINIGSLPRWSQYGAPQPYYVVNVTSATDVANTVKYCNQYNLSFVAQNGGHGWANTFSLGQCGVLINLAALNQTTFNGDQTEAFIGGGVSVRAMVHAAYRNHARFATATCNCVGFLGATLGGGLTRTAGLYGMGVDQLLSAEIVTAFGDVRYVDGGDIDLWWALKGAAPNIGIVTSAVVKAYPILDADNIAWQGLLTFSDDKLEALISAINDLYLEPRMQIDFMMASQPNGTTRIGAIPFFLGNTSAGRVAFTSILDIGPLADGTQEYPYNMWNAFGDYACVPAGRKPAYGVSLNNLDPPTWRTVYEDFKVFLATNPEATNSAIFAENYPINSSTIQNGAGSFPWRDVKTHVAIYPWYANTSLDAAANAWGSTTRTLLRSTDGVQGHANYVNFAHGDESLNDIYGPNLPRLQTLKRQYDPYNRLNQWFPIH